MSFPARLMILALLLIISVGRGFGAELRATVKYISSSAVYLDQGRAAGLEVGNRVQIIRGDSVITELVIAFVADNSASCQLPENAAAILIGDIAVAVVPNRMEPADDSAINADTLSGATADAARAEDRSKRTHASNRISGSIGVQVIAQDDREPFNYDYTQRSLQIRTAISRIGGSDYKISIRANLREAIRNRETSSATNSATNHRLYEMARQY